MQRCNLAQKQRFMSDIQPAEIFNRVNEAKYLSGYEDITPEAWAGKRVIYYHKQISESKSLRQTKHNERLLEIWEAVVKHFKENG